MWVWAYWHALSQCLSFFCLPLSTASTHHDRCPWPPTHPRRRLVATPHRVRSIPGPSPAGLAAMCHHLSLDHQTASRRGKLALPSATLQLPDRRYGDPSRQSTPMAAERPRAQRPGATETTAHPGHLLDCSVAMPTGSSRAMHNPGSTAHLKPALALHDDSEFVWSHSSAHNADFARRLPFSLRI